MYKYKELIIPKVGILSPTDDVLQRMYKKVEAQDGFFPWLRGYFPWQSRFESTAT